MNIADEKMVMAGCDEKNGHGRVLNYITCIRCARVLNTADETMAERVRVLNTADETKVEHVRVFGILLMKQK